MRKAFFFILVFLMVVCLSGCGGRPKIKNLRSLNDNIIAFGDSITEGYGSRQDQAYPRILSELIGRKIINAGKSGDSTRDALERIEEDVLEKSPKLVFLQFGANDVFKNIPKEETFKNLNQMAMLIQEKGGMVVLIHVRVGVIADAYLKGYKEIAKKRRAFLVRDIMKGILDNPKLKYDTVHPNFEGQKVIAERIHKAITPILENMI